MGVTSNMCFLSFQNKKKIVRKFNPSATFYWKISGKISMLLKCTSGKAALPYEEFETIICDCESVINSWPLTYVSENSKDLIPLTFSVFLKQDLLM